LLLQFDHRRSKVRKHKLREEGKGTKRTCKCVVGKGGGGKSNGISSARKRKGIPPRSRGGLQLIEGRKRGKAQRIPTNLRRTRKKKRNVPTRKRKKEKEKDSKKSRKNEKNSSPAPSKKKDSTTSERGGEKERSDPSSHYDELTRGLLKKGLEIEEKKREGNAIPFPP